MLNLFLFDCGQIVCIIIVLNILLIILFTTLIDEAGMFEGPMVKNTMMSRVFTGCLDGVIWMGI